MRQVKIALCTPGSLSSEIFYKQFLLASDSGVTASVSLRKNFAPLVRVATAFVGHTDLRVPFHTHRQMAAHVLARAYSVSSMSPADNPARPGTRTPPKELALSISPCGSLDYAMLVASTASVVGDLKKDVKNFFQNFRNVDEDLITFQLQVTEVDGTVGSGASGCGAAKTKLVPLASTDTIFDASKIALGRSLTPQDTLRIVFDVAGTPRVGSAPFDPALGIDIGLWKAMSQEVQDRALLVAKERKKLAAVPMLCDMRAKMTVEQAKQNNVKVLEARGDDVKLGVFDVCAVDSIDNVVDVRGDVKWSEFDNYPNEKRCKSGRGGFLDPKYTTHFFVPERAALVEEFLDELDARKVTSRASGVLVTGPTGVGKSAVGLLAYLCCLAKNHFVVYVPNSNDWLTAAQSGLGDEFLVERFFLQNLDLIAAEPSLRHVFDSRFCGVPIGIDVVAAFRNVLSNRPGPAVAVIVDDVQYITKETESASSVLSGPIKAANYFAQGWTTWDNKNSCFVRMDITGSHYVRNLKLSSGDERRLRCVRPWSHDSAAVALAHNASPAFVVKANNARSRILCIGGGIIGHLLRCKHVLCGVVTKGRLDNLEIRMREFFFDACLEFMWDDDGRLFATRSLVPLFRGQVAWTPGTSTYGAGLLAMKDAGKFLEPVSSVAASVLHWALSLKIVRMRVPLSSYDDDTERGYDLVRQVQSRLCTSNYGLVSVRLNGSPGPHWSMLYCEMRTCHEPKDTIAGRKRTLYLPDHDNFGCDFIVVPSALAPTKATVGAAREPLQIWECSLTDPRSSDRVEKCLDWFKSGGLIASMQAAHPSKPIAIIFCWPGDIDKTAHDKSRYDKYKALEDTAAAFDVEIRVLDNHGLWNLGVRL